MDNSQILHICPKCGELIGGKKECSRCHYNDVIPTEYNTSIIEYMIKNETPSTYEKFKQNLREKYTVNSDVFDKEIYQELIDEEQWRFEQREKDYEEEQKEIKQYQESLKHQNIPKCPTCGSTNIEKISTSRKITGGLFFGLFSSDVRKTFHCKNCGYKW